MKALFTLITMVQISASYLIHTLHCNSPVVGNVFGLRVCLFFLLCPHEVGLECSRNGLFKIDCLCIISTVMENCRDFSFHCLHKAEPASQEFIDVTLLIPEIKNGRSFSNQKEEKFCIECIFFDTLLLTN